MAQLCLRNGSVGLTEEILKNKIQFMDTRLTYCEYTRKSSEDNKERQVASLPDQHRELQETAKRFDLPIKQFLEESRSAHTIGRPVFNQLILDIEEGRVNAILTWHPNRLARNAFDAGNLIYLMDMGKLIEIRTPSRAYHNTPEDKFMLTLEFGISKKDSDDKSIVVGRGLKSKAQAGWRPGVAPHGYLNDRGAESGTRRIHIDPERFEFIKKIFQMKYEGIPVREILKTANEDWGFRTRPRKRYPAKPLAQSVLYKMLANPFYCGRFYYSGQWYEGSHEKAVEPEVFDQIQIMLGGSVLRVKPHTKQFAYTGLIRCGECSGTVTAEEKTQIICSNCKYKFAATVKSRTHCPKCNTAIAEMKNPKILEYCYYHCTKKLHQNCTQKYAQVGNMEDQIKEDLEKLEISDCFMDWAIRQINMEADQEKDFRDETLKSLQRTLDDCRQELHNLLKLKISPLNTDGSLISDEKFKTEKNKLEIQILDLERKIGKIDERMLKFAQESADKFDFAAHAKERFDNTEDLSVKHDILSKLGSNLTLKGRKIYYDSPNFFVTIKNIKADEPIIGRRFEPGFQAYTKPQLEALYASSPTVLRG